jgi:DNA processing protein
MIRNLGPVRIRAMEDMLGSPQAVFEAGHEVLCRIKGIGPHLAETILRERDQIDVARELQTAARQGIHIFACCDPQYPDVLKSIYDPPVVLYVRGTLERKDEHALALVGSRRCTHYGLGTADRLAYQLAKTGYTVVSGLARGIDTAAHQGALKGGGRTLAVLGGALDRLYPKENAKLADAIAEQGAVISEFPFGREPDRTTFPYRNRVVSGLSQGVLVVESPLKSGSLITAEMAAEQGRTVFAVPGRIDTPAARGCHMLIKNGARLVESVNDIFEEFDMLLPPERTEDAARSRKRPDMQLSDAEARVVRALAQGGMDMDVLARSAELSSSAVSGVMLGLEMKRVVKMLPGRRVELCVSADDLLS